MNHLQKIATLIKLLPLALALAQPAGAQSISDTDKRLNAHGDHGYWQSGQPDVMILWPQDQQNIVKRFTGSAGHPYPYRLWVEPGRAGGFPVVLKNLSTFNNFLNHIKTNADKDWCQLAETWSNWQGSPPTTCGIHSYTQQRSCTVAVGATKPCPDLCQSPLQTRSRTIDNGACAPQPPVQQCTPGAWSPSAASVCAGQSFTQTRTLADCSADSRTATGSKSCSSACTLGAWSPGRDTACSRDTLTQTRTLADCSTDSRTVSGTRSCPSSCTVTSWAPAASTVCSGTAFTQTRTLGNCSGDSRSATGTKYCPKPCNATPWSPDPDTECSGTQFTQTRKRSDCSNDSRSATGTKSCPITCAATGWEPGKDTVCKGDTFIQTSTLKNCSTDSRSAKGNKCCGAVTAWSPDPATKCGSFTQTRTNTCGKTESRTAKGTAQWCGCRWGPYTPATNTVCKGQTFTQSSHYSCSGRHNKPRTQTATGTKSCPKACTEGQSYCSAYKMYLCRNGKWEVIAHGPYACFTP